MKQGNIKNYLLLAKEFCKRHLLHSMPINCCWKCALSAVAKLLQHHDMGCHFCSCINILDSSKISAILCNQPWNYSCVEGNLCSVVAQMAERVGTGELR